MKRGNIDKWTDIDACENLLFFSQLVNELLFDYSIPSNRISTLNSHYLCLDAISSIDGIENNGVPEGTLKPIIEELYEELKKDPIFDNDNSPTQYFVKYQNDKYILCGNVKDINYRDQICIVNAIDNLFFENNNYFNRLKDGICSIIKDNNAENQQVLFRMTKSLLTELMNGGYSLRYLYYVMSNLFWESRTSINSTKTIDDFFNLFDFNEKEYTVVFKVKNKINKFIKYLDGLECVEELPEDIRSKAGRSFLSKKKDETFLIIQRKAMDPYDAADSAQHLIETNSAVYRLYDHKYKYQISSAVCEIFDENNKYRTGKEIRAVEHTKMPSNRQISESLEVANKAILSAARADRFNDCISILSAIQYHSHSLDSRSEENMLLDLWAIFETILNISNKHTSDRIQQVCMYLVPLLKQKYFYSLFKQLANDIRNYNEDIFKEIVTDTDLNNEYETIKKVCEFSLLQSNAEKREQILIRCNDFPLLKERINYYNAVLGTPAQIHAFVEKHAVRVRWQIMRIYRNRNLIIHNGSNMPYLHLLIENLHSYVDDFISYTIHSLAKDKDINSMCQDLFVKECKWNATFPRGKDPVTTDQIEYMLSM